MMDLHKDFNIMNANIAELYIKEITQALDKFDIALDKAAKCFENSGSIEEVEDILRKSITQMRYPISNRVDKLRPDIKEKICSEAEKIFLRSFTVKEIGKYIAISELLEEWAK